MTRTRITLTAATLCLATLGLAGLLSLAGGGLAGAAQRPVTDETAEASVLREVGFDTGVRPVRRYLRKNTLHGEIIVRGKDGVRTVVVQRGAVTAVTSKTVTVKSTDGFALTWTFGDQLRVVQDKKRVQASALKSGAEVGVAGAKNGDVNAARLIAIR